MRRGVGRSLPVSYSLPHFGGFYKGEFVGSSPLSLAGRLPSPFTLRLPVALSVSFADSSPTGGAKSTPVGAG